MMQCCSIRCSDVPCGVTHIPPPMKSPHQLTDALPLLFLPPAPPRLTPSGGSASTSMPKTLKSDKWKKIVPQLTVQGGRACYGGRAMVVAAGPMTLPSCIPDGAGIH